MKIQMKLKNKSDDSFGVLWGAPLSFFFFEKPKKKVSRLVGCLWFFRDEMKRNRDFGRRSFSLSLFLSLSLKVFFSRRFKRERRDITASRYWRTTKQRTRCLVCPSTRQRHHRRRLSAVSREEEEDESNPGLTGRNFLNRKRKSNTKEGGDRLRLLFVLRRVR